MVLGESSGGCSLLACKVQGFLLLVPVRLQNMFINWELFMEKECRLWAEQKFHGGSSRCFNGESRAVALESIIGCAGERCLAGSVIVSVGEKTHQEIESRITLLAKEITVGDGLDPKVQMGPLISKRSQTASSKFNSIGHRSRRLASYWMDEKMSTICLGIF